MHPSLEQAYLANNKAKEGYLPEVLRAALRDTIDLSLQRISTGLRENTPQTRPNRNIKNNG